MWICLALCSVLNQAKLGAQVRIYATLRLNSFNFYCICTQHFFYTASEMTSLESRAFTVLQGSGAFVSPEVKMVDVPIEIVRR